MIPERSTAFGGRVRRRLTEEQIIWLTTVGRDGTPQPNPVWFLWQGDDTVLIYSLTTAHRLTNIRRNPSVCLHFNGNDHGGDIVVLTGTAEILDDCPSAADSSDYRDKYAEGMERVSGSVQAFAEDYAIPLLVRVTRARGF